MEHVVPKVMLRRRHPDRVNITSVSYLQLIFSRPALSKPIRVRYFYIDVRARKPLRLLCEAREGVQSIHDPCKLTSEASWFAEWSPSQLLANQNRLRASCYVWQAAQLCLTTSNSISNNKYLAFTSTKSLFSKKSQHVHKVFNDT